MELGAGLTLSLPLSVGTLQWGTTAIDNSVINAKGCITDATAHQIAQAFSDAGVTLWDTAEGYGGGTSEQRLGRTAANSNGVIIMTKFLPTFWRWRHADFERALRRSLRNLGTSSCHIYLLHSPVHWKPIEFWVEAAAICHRKGLMQAMGLSNCNAEEVRRAYNAGQRYGVPVILNQVMYNLLDYNSPKLQEMEATCKELGVTIVAYSPLGQGLLTDGLTPEILAKNRPARMTGLTFEKLLPLRSCMKQIADSHSKTMGQVAVNWCVCKGTVPLVGCRSAAQAQDSVGGVLGWRLSAEEVKQLDRVALSRSTLESPRWRRAIFVGLASMVMMACRIADALGLLVSLG
mmetsp:Transcript_63780/g.152087  ORF Transcript_63780/g.152087 Transcript_63780/m.152087 type:complete len:347 (+) Transcript_63780:74-1114(+)